MKPEPHRCKCLNCKQLFIPDYRNRRHQQFCSAPECKRASKRVRQQRWLSKPQNRDYFRDADNRQRVKDWRKANPGYWKRYQRKPRPTLQDDCPTQPAVEKELAPAPLPDACRRTLQDICQVQVPLMVGLISKFSDCTLPDDIVNYVRTLIAKGLDILDTPSSRSAKANTVYDDKQKDPATGSLAASAGAV